MARCMSFVILSLLALAPATAEAGHGHFCGGGWGGISLGIGPGFGCYQPRMIGGYYGGYYGGGCYPYGGYYDAFNPYGIYYAPRYGYAEYYLPPVFAPAELLYGPRAVKQFLGIEDRPLVLGAGDRGAEDAAKPRVSSPTYRRKAEQFLAQGDALFREQKYAQAVDRYRQATVLAPDLAEVHWRKGHAYVAMHRYELATAAMKRALELSADVDRGGFSLTRLYGDGATVKTSHLETLAGEALVHGDSADVYFLLGVFLRYDGQSERAEKFFRRAQELTGGAAEHLAAFLKPMDVPVAARELET